MKAERLGDYLLTERFGSGAATEVFRATSFGVEGFEKSFALKRPIARLAGVARFIDAFVVETRKVAGLSHANVVPIVDTGRADSIFVVTELVEGIDLATLFENLRRARLTLPVDLALHLAAEVAKGLDYAHRRRKGAVVHAGLSPSNVLLSRDGDVKVSDFGVHAALAAANFAPDEARSLPYRAPETLVDPTGSAAADVFALGAMLHEALTLAPAFRGADADETQRRLVSGARSPLDNADLAPLVARLLGASDARPTAGRVHEELVGKLYSAPRAHEPRRQLADLVTRLGRDVSVGGPLASVALGAESRTASAIEGAVIEPVNPDASSVGVAQVQSLARVREVTVVSIVGGTEDAIASTIGTHGGVVIARDEAETRAVFGARASDGRDVVAALHAALAITAFESGKSVNVGIDLARALVDEASEIVVDADLAPRFHVASGLAHAGSGRVHVTSAVAKVARADFEMERDGATSALRVVGPRRRPLTSARFVGRSNELATVAKLFGRIVDEGPKVVAIVAPPGMGKTRLALELERRIQRARSSSRAIYVACPTASGPLGAANALAREICGRAIDGAPRRDDCIAASRDTALVVLDDLEIADAASVEWFEAFVGDLHAASIPALVVLVGRALPAVLRGCADEVCDLAALSGDEAAELVSALLGARVLPAELVAFISEWTEHSPLFIEQSVRELQDLALVTVRDGVAIAETTRAALPRTPRALVESRVARLSREAQTLLRAMAVVGDDAAADELASITGLSSSAVREIASSLVPEFAITPRSALAGVVRLKRAATEVVIDGVPIADRMALHASAARAIRARPHLDASAREAIGEHLAAAGDRLGAVGELQRAADEHTALLNKARAAKRLLTHAPTDVDVAVIVASVAHLARAAAVLHVAQGSTDLVLGSVPAVDAAAPVAARVAIRVDAAQIASVECAFEQARVALDQARAIAAGDTTALAIVAAAEVRIANETGEVARGKDGALALLAGDTTDVRALASAAELLASAGDAAATDRALARAVELACDAEPEVRAHVEVARGRAEMALGRSHEALRTAANAGDLARGTGSMALAAFARLTLGQTLLELGQPERAHASFVTALEAAQEAGQERVEALALAHLAHLEHTRASPSTRRSSIPRLRELAARARARGFTSDAMDVASLEALALAASGDQVAAVEALERVIDEAALAGDHARERRARARLAALSV